MSVSVSGCPQLMYSFVKVTPCKRSGKRPWRRGATHCMRFGCSFTTRVCLGVPALLYCVTMDALQESEEEDCVQHTSTSPGTLSPGLPG